MGRLRMRWVAVLLGVSAMCGCATTDGAEAPTFGMTTPSSAPTTSPARLAWLGDSDLTPPERALCSFIGSADAALVAVEEQNRTTLASAEEAVKDPTMSEPIRVRRLRDAELANADRFAAVLLRFVEGREVLQLAGPTDNLPREAMDDMEADMDAVVAIGEAITATIAALKPLDADGQAAYHEETGVEWRDLFTEAELADVRAELYDDQTGMGRADEARALMDRIDDWSWRHCSQGFSD